MTNKKSTKKALLMSALSLLLCMSMLVGTTFAWFTDSVTTNKNIITAGNLDVNLYYKTTAMNDWAPVKANTNVFSGNLWEPGHTEVVYLKVVNEGTLALKYDLIVNVASEIAGTNVDGKEFKLSDYILYNIYEGEEKYTDSADARGDETGNKLNVPYNKPAQKLEPGAEVKLTMVVFMPTTVGNEANYLTGTAAPVINLGINLFATQQTHESDSFGPDYDAGAEPVVIYTADELAAALTSNEETISVILGNDIDLPRNLLIGGNSGDEYKMGGADTKAINIDLNGRKLNITTSYWSVLGTVNPATVVTFANGTMTSSQATGTWNSYDLTFASGKFVFENVTFEKAIALETNAVLKNVTINETHDYYAMWISAEGQTVEIDGLTINSNGRGIKIDEQYVAAPEKVTLNVSNATFNTNKKAAIMVKSAEGADITLNNVNISGVAADPFNTVWVDEDAASYANLVAVNGGSVIVEGSTEAPKSNSVAAGTTVNMSSVINAGTQTVINNEGTIDLSGTPGLNGGDVVVNGGTVVTTSANYTGLQHAGEVTYNNVTFNGSTFLYGDKVVFNNCTFNLPTNYVWTYGAAEVEFNNCTFNTNGKAILIYNEGPDLVTNVSVKGCTFNTTASAGKAAIEIGSRLAVNGHYTLTTENNTVDPKFAGEWRIKDSATNNTTVNGVIYNYVADGLYKGESNVFYVYNANGLEKMNTMMADKTAGRDAVVNLLSDIDFSGKTWTPVDSHADSKFEIAEINGNGHTISNLTINGQAMFRRFAGTGDVVIKDITFDGATVNSNGNINTAIVTGHTYQNVLLDNVDVKNSTITGGYKVAPLIATVYNENPNSTITATLKNCDVENVVVTATSYDFCTTGMVAFVYADDADAIAFENCSVKNVKLYAPNAYTAHAAVYTTGSETLFNEADGVTVTDVTFENK